MNRPSPPPPSLPPPGLAPGGCLVPVLMVTTFLAAFLLLATGRWLGERWAGTGGGVVGALAGLAVGALLILGAVRYIRGMQARRLAEMADDPQVPDPPE